MEFLTLKKDRFFVLGIAAVSVLFGLFLLQDLMQAMLKDYSFYLSEAALFNGFWLLFLPVIVFSSWLSQRLKSREGHSRFSMVLIFMTTVALHLGLFVCWVHGGSLLLLDHVYAFKWTLKYALAENLYPTVIGYAFVLLAKAVKEKELLVGSRIIPNALPVFTQRLAVRVKLETIYLNVEDISCLQAESPYVAIRTQGRKYLEDTTLKALASQLPPEQFARIHRSCIVNLSWVCSLSSRGNGDYDIVLRDDSIHRLSRNYAAEYKRRMAEHQLA